MKPSNNLGVQPQGIAQTGKEAPSVDATRNDEDRSMFISREGTTATWRKANH